MNEHLLLLGHKARDLITEVEGVVVSISFDLTGCVQALLQPQGATDKPVQWFDTKRLKMLTQEPLMPQPTFSSVPGPIAKPTFAQRPAK
jgi:hypothetical protein